MLVRLNKQAGIFARLAQSETNYNQRSGAQGTTDRVPSMTGSLLVSGTEPTEPLSDDFGAALSSPKGADGHGTPEELSEFYETEDFSKESRQPTEEPMSEGTKHDPSDLFEKISEHIKNLCAENDEKTGLNNYKTLTKYDYFPKTLSNQFDELANKVDSLVEERNYAVLAAVEARRKLALNKDRQRDIEQQMEKTKYEIELGKHKNLDSDKEIVELKARNTVLNGSLKEISSLISSLNMTLEARKLPELKRLSPAENSASWKTDKDFNEPT